MFTLKNPFAKLTSSTSPAPGVLDAEDSLKGKQLLRERTKAKVETLTADLDTARLALAQAEQALGEKMADGLESTSDADAMNHAADHVRALEVALSVATAKDEAAQAELRAAERQAAIDADDEVVDVFLCAVQKLDTLQCGELKRAADAVGVAYKAVKDQCESDSGVMGELRRFSGYYPTYLLHELASLIREGGRFIQDIDKDHKTLAMQAEEIRHAMACRKRSR